MRLLLTESLLLALLGIASRGIASLAIAWAGVHALGTIDPSAILRASRPGAAGGAAFILCGIAALACYVPARSAALLDPARTPRAD